MPIWATHASSNPSTPLFRVPEGTFVRLSPISTFSSSSLFALTGCSPSPQVGLMPFCCVWGPSPIAFAQCGSARLDNFAYTRHPNYAKPMPHLDEVLDHLGLVGIFLMFGLGISQVRRNHGIIVYCVPQQERGICGHGATGC